MPMIKSQSSFFAPGDPAVLGSEHPPIRDFLLREAKGAVLDVGGGVGAYADVLRRAGHDVTLAEISDKSLDAARGIGLNVVDMKQVTFAELAGRFETVQLVEVLEHVDDPRSFLGQALEIAGERVLLSVPCSNDFAELFGFHLTYAHIAVTDHQWHFTDADIRALFPEGWDVQIELVDHLGPLLWKHLLERACKSHKAWLWATYPLRVLFRRGYFVPQYPTRMLIKATRRR